jgi:F-type H+-transporting ATPase subunit epsilon
MNLIVLTPEKEIYQGQITSVKVPGISGQFEILNNHAPIVAALGQGDVRILDAKGDKKIFNIKKGFIEVLKNEVSLLVQGVKE